MDKLVSVIIPVYNGEQYLEQAVDSVLAQSYKNIEIICVNDGSADRTEKLVKTKYSQIKYIKHETNLGLSAAMNTGLKEAKGDWLSELDCDDILEKDYVSLCVADGAGFKGADIVGSWQKEFGERGETHYFHPNPVYEDFLNGNKINCSSMYKRRVYEVMLKEYGFMYDERLAAYMDWQLWIRATKAGFTVATIPLALFYYRIRQGSLITNLIAEGGRDAAFEKMKDSLPEVFYRKE